ncbi:related to aquaporin-9 [Rhynchosporium secalis]|uniref:Related to aquaporin-9 n=1 Tax=Rhynchosporium secalis TaxID=38038 RepID=A0A1E1MVD6_RHYSE|nr:related to aquaporin-9 [Rhynchosporium secalis]
MSSDSTAYSPTASPRAKDWAESHHHNEGQYGSGPGLRDPDSTIQNSDRAYAKHLEKQADIVGPSPATRRPSSPSDSPRYGHFEHRDERGSPSLSPPPQNNETDLAYHPSAKAAVSTESHKTQHQVDREHTVSTLRTKIGLSADAPIVDDHNVHSHLRWSSVRVMMREPFAEFLGTFVMILFGNGSVAQVLLSTGQTGAPGGSGFGSYQSISWGWGLGVMLGIYVAGDSGGFLNPAITFCFCLFRKLPWKRFPIYFIAQVLGAFCASGVVYANYIPAIDQLEGHGIRTVPPSETATAGIFCTYPQAFLTNASQIFSEFIASTILMLVIFALKDDSNPGAMGKTGAGQMFPLALFFLIFGLGACFGWETGYAINLARDFGPRLMSYAVGYGNQVWSAGDYYFWIPIVIPFLGCIFGAFVYDAMVYTGPESPLNRPSMGLQDLAIWLRLRRREKRRSEKYDV